MPIMADVGVWEMSERDGAADQPAEAVADVDRSERSPIEPCPGRCRTAAPMTVIGTSVAPQRMTGQWLSSLRAGVRTTV